MDGIEVKGAGELFQLGPFVITETILSMIVVTLLLAVAGILLGRNLQKRPGSRLRRREKPNIHPHPLPPHPGKPRQPHRLRRRPQ